MKQLKLAAVAMGIAISLLSAPVHAIDVFGGCGSGAGNSEVCAAASDDDATNMVMKIINVMLIGIGITAIILIVHSGLKYVTSRGDPANVKSAKDTLLYAVIGLVVALMAFAIVNFILDQFSGGGTP